MIKMKKNVNVNLVSGTKDNVELLERNQQLKQKLEETNKKQMMYSIRLIQLEEQLKKEVRKNITHKTDETRVLFDDDQNKTMENTIKEQQEKL